MAQSRIVGIFRDGRMCRRGYAKKKKPIQPTRATQGTSEVRVEHCLIQVKAPLAILCTLIIIEETLVRVTSFGFFDV